MKKITVILAAIVLLGLIQANAARAAGSDTLYAIGSVSKVFTAAAVMKLVESGQIDLDAPVVSYIPEFEMADERYMLITPRMLLNHSSGLMGSTFRNAMLLGENNTYLHDNFLEFLKDARLRHDPGDRSIYCNDGFTLAEILVERVSGMSFTEFIEREFAAPLGLENIKTPQSDFDRARLADIYLGDNALLPKGLSIVGTGGIYSTVEDLCRYATIFMDDNDGSVLSLESAREMAAVQHKMDVLPDAGDDLFFYGLGWDSVDSFPFNRYGIQALSKGGSTILYNANLTVLPEHNLAVAVASSGRDSLSHIISQEIILAILIEEGILPPDADLSPPAPNNERALIPDSVKQNAGIYDTGYMGEILLVDFTDDTLVLTPFATPNERPREFIYNTDGEFVSKDGNYIGFLAGAEDTYGSSVITFEGNYLVMRTYLDIPGLGIHTQMMPFAERIEALDVPTEVAAAWEARNDKEYLLVSDRYTSFMYVMEPYAITLTDDRAPGYVTMGVYESPGFLLPTARITDANKAEGFVAIPTMFGRDCVDLAISTINGVEYLDINNGDSIFMDASNARRFSELGDAVTVGSETVWADVDAGFGGRVIYIDTPRNGAWFIYNDKMDCIATSLEKNPRSMIILPDNGRIAFAGEPGAVFYQGAAGTALRGRLIIAPTGAVLFPSVSPNCIRLSV